MAASDPALLAYHLGSAGVSALQFRYLEAYDILIDPLGASITKEVLRTGSYSLPLASRFMDRMKDANFALVNIGANIGTTCLNFHALGVRTFLALEPVTKNFAMLRNNIANLPDSDVTVLQCACSDQAGEAEINLHSQSGGRHSLVYDYEGGTEQIKLIRLDDLQLPENPVLWIDTEGAEADVLDGFATGLQTYRPPLCIEISPEMAGAEVIDRIAARLEPLGYTFVGPSGSEVSELRRVPGVTDQRQTDVFALPS